jgi:two-component system, chemotaxis family, protein-glutamate methylesterase/glutaminase
MSPENSNHVRRVLVVEDSALMGRQISNILNSAPDLTVIGRARDGLEALSMVEEFKPDVITMDVEMPRMNGITALKHVMVKYSIPTVMISALTTEGATTSFDALKFGAIDVIAKPSQREDESLEAQQADIVAKVRRAAEIRTGRARYIRITTNLSAYAKQGGGKPGETSRFIGIGAGTGGYYSLLRIIPALPAGFEHVLIANILIASRYVEPFVNYLDAYSEIPIKAVRNSMTLERGVCYICSYQDRLIVERDGSGEVKLDFADAGADSDLYKEAMVDKLFESLANTVGNRAVAVVLTGPGSAGALGLLEVRRAGGMGVVQDINNCMDPSMPIAVLEKSPVEKMLPDYLIADFLLSLK